MGVISSDSLSKMPESTYLIVDSCIMVVLFYLISAFLFSSLSDYFPGELIRTLASENKNPTLNMIGFSFIFDARLLITGNN